MKNKLAKLKKLFGVGVKLGLFFVFAFIIYSGYLPFKIQSAFSPSRAEAATVTAVNSGNWSTGSTWSTGSAPGTSDTAQIGGTYTVTVTGNATVGAVNFLSTSTAGTLSVNTGVTLTVTGAITAISAASTAATSTITGAGTVTAASVAVGSGGPTPGATVQTDLISTIANLTISGGITLTSYYKSTPYYNDPTLEIQSGTTTAASITTSGAHSGDIQTVTMATGAHTGYLKLTAATTVWTLGTGTNTITLNGAGATVEYSGATPAMDVTTYYNLVLSGGGAATGAVTTVQGGLIFNNTSTSWSTTANLAITGNLALATSTTLTTGANYTLTVGGPSSITGLLALSNTGTKSFTGLVTVNANGSITSASTGAQTYTGGLTLSSSGSFSDAGGSAIAFGAGGFTNNSGSTINMGTGAITFSASCALAGTSSTTFGGTMTIATSIIVNNSNTATTTIAVLNISSPTSGANGLTLAAGTNTVVTGALTFSANAAATASYGQTLTLSADSGSLKANLSAGSIVFTAPTNAVATLSTISCLGTGTISVSGAVTLNGNTTSASGGLVSIQLNAATLNVTGLIKLVGGTTGDTATLSMTTGTLGVGGGITFAATLATDVFSNTGAGIINFSGGTISGAAGSFTVNAYTIMNTTGTPTIGGAYTFGALNVVSGTTAMGAFAVSFASTTVVSGTLNVSSATGIKTFTGAVTVNTGGVFDMYTASTYATASVFGAGITAGGTTFNSGSGLATTTGSFYGSGNINFEGALNIAASQTTVNNNTGTVTVTDVLTLNGNWQQGTGSTLNYGSASAVAGSGTFDASTYSNTVNYTATGGTVKDPNAGTLHTYQNLGLSGSGTNTKTMTSVTTILGNLTMSGSAAATPVLTSIGGNVSISGTAALTTGANLTVSGTLGVDTGSILNLGGFTFTESSTTSATGTVDTVTSATGIKTFTGLITINSGGVFNMSGQNPQMAFGGGITNNSNAANAFNAGSNANNTLVGNLSGTGTTNMVFGGALAISSGTTTNNFTGASTTIAGTLTLSGSSSWVQGANSILSLGAATPITTGGNTFDTFTNQNTVIYSAAAGSQSVVATTYYNLTFRNTSGTNTAAGSLVVNGTLITTAGGTLDLGTSNTLSGTLATITNNGTIKTSSVTAAIPSGLAWGGTIEYGSATGGQTIVSETSYTNLKLDNSTSGTDTAAAATVINGTLTVPANGTLDMSTFQMTGTPTIANSGIIKTSNTSSPAIPGGFTWGGTVQFAAAAGGQSIATGTFATLIFSNSSATNTAVGTLTVNTALTTTAGGALNMAGYPLAGTLTTITNSGTIETQNVSATPLTTGKTWGGTVLYDALTGGQTIMAGTYATTTLANTGGTDTSGGNLTVNTLFNISSGGTFNPGAATYTIAGTGTLTGSGTVKVSDNAANAFLTQYSITNKTLTSLTVDYTGGASQGISSTTYSNLTFDGAVVGVGTGVVTGALTVNASGSFVPTSGTITMNSGSTITNSNSAGSLAFYGLTIASGSVTGNTSFSVTNIFTNSSGGVFTSNSGTITCAGCTISNSGTTLTFKNLSTTGTATAGSSANFTVAGNFAVSSGTFTSTSNTLTIGGNFTNSGTFTHNSGTVVFNGTGISTLAGATTFYNLKDVTAGSTLAFTHGQIFTIAGTLTLTGTSGSNVTLTSDNGSSAWTVHFTSAQSSATITYSTISWSGCDAGTANATLTDGTYTNGGNNGSCWVFSSFITMSGTIYNSGDTGALTGFNGLVSLAVASTSAYSASAVSGAFTFSNVVRPPTSTDITIWLNTGGATSSSLVFMYGNGCAGGNCTGLTMIQNMVVIDNKDPADGNMNITDLVGCTNTFGSACSDTDIGFIATTTPTASTTLTFASNTLYVMPGVTFSPGGAVTAQNLNVAGTYSDNNNATISSGNVSGSGTINMTGGTFEVDGTGNFGGSGPWTFNNLNIGNNVAATTTSVATATTTVTGALTIGSTSVLNAGSNIWDLTASGNPFVVNSGGTFNAQTSTFSYEDTSGTSNPAAVSYNNLDFSPSSGSPTFQLTSPAPSGWYSTGGTWLYRKAITINHNLIASSTGETYANFPVLISITDPNLASFASTTGADILFTKSDGITKLKHEIESFSSSNGQLIAWVNVGAGGLSTSTDTTLYMYYGNSSAANQQNVAGTWNSNYIGVWHFPNGTTLSAADSTGYANGTITGATATTTCEFYACASFNGTTQNINFGTGSNFNIAAPFTISGWYYVTSVSTDSLLFGRDDYNYRFLAGADGAGYYAAIAEFNGNIYSSNQISTGAWHLLTYVATSTGQTIYVDGALNYTGSESGNTFVDSGVAVRTGYGVSIGAYPLNGEAQEERFASGVSSPDWIKTEYNNQSAPGAFISTGTVQSYLSMPSGPITVSGNLTVNGGTVDANTNNVGLTVGGNVAISSGTFLAPSSSTFSIAGDFTNNGTFTNEGGTITFSSSTAISVISGTSTVFNNLTVSTAGTTLEFQHETSNFPVFTFAGLFAATGTSGSLVTIESDLPGTQWLPYFNSVQVAVSYANIIDSGCAAGTANITVANSTNGGDNGSCWLGLAALLSYGGGETGAMSFTNPTGITGGGTQETGGGAGGGGTGSSTPPSDTSGGDGDGGGTQQSDGSGGDAGGGGASP